MYLFKSGEAKLPDSKILKPDLLVKNKTKQKNKQNKTTASLISLWGSWLSWIVCSYCSVVHEVYHELWASFIVIYM